MSIQSRRLAIKQLDRTLAEFKPLRRISRPKGGWLKAVRKVLGMSGRQLGVRAGMTQATVANIEERECLGTATMATMEKMAKAMDCTFVYAIVPNATLEQSIAKRAEELARQRVLDTAFSMSLEKQGVASEETEAQIAMITQEILATLPRYLWDGDGA